MDFVPMLLDWYAKNARALPWRAAVDPYAIWLSEVMLQQTRVGAVLSYYKRWMAALPDIPTLAAVDDARLHKLWEGLGYYNRARNLKRAAIELMDKHGGKLPNSYEALKALPGIGEYTAGAIASIAFGEAVPAVDGNVLRVWARLMNDSRDVLEPKTKAAFRADIARVIPQDAPGAFNAALMELGETICLPNARPLCADCPIGAQCRAYQAGTAETLPVRSKKKPRRVVVKTAFVLLQGGNPAVYKRAEKGLLAGLWQLPETEGFLSAEQAAERLTAWGARPEGEWRCYERRHVFTHIEWHMRVYAVEVSMPLPDGWRWLDDTMPLPVAYRVCLPG